MRTRKAVGALIINENNEILLVHKIKIMDGSVSSVPVDEWDFIKGGIKDNEDILEALHRELIEEVNIKEYVSITKLPEFTFDFSDSIKKILNYDNQITYFFKIQINSKISIIKLDLEEINDTKFTSIDEAMYLLKHDTTKQYLQNIVDKGYL